MALCDDRSYSAVIAAKPHGVTMEMALRLLLLCFALWQSIAGLPAMHVFGAAVHLQINT